MRRVCPGRPACRVDLDLDLAFVYELKRGEPTPIRTRTTRPTRRNPGNCDDLPVHRRTTQSPPHAHRDHPHPGPPRRNLQPRPPRTTHLGHTPDPSPNPAPPAPTPPTITLARKR